MKKLLIIAIALAGPACGQPKNAAKKPDADTFRKQQEKLIDEHVAILARDGRVPVDFSHGYATLGRYGWHSDVGSTVGPAANAVHRFSNSGSYGAYSFYRPAFDQAKRSWWIIGMMKAGSDLLVAINRNARFDNSDCSYWSASDGTSGKDCPPPKANSPLGFLVGPMYDSESQSFIRDAVVVEVVSYDKVRLNKRAKGDVLQYDLGILPPDYIDMCACKM